MKICKLSGVMWTDEIFVLGVTVWRTPFQIDLNLGFFKIIIGGENGE